MIKKWEYSAKILTYLYRAVLNSMISFTFPWDEKHVKEMGQKGSLDNGALNYIRRAATIIECRGEFSQLARNS